MNQGKEVMGTRSTIVRLTSTVLAGLAAYAAVGIYALLAGPPDGYLEVAVLLILFTAVYVPGVFGARRLIRAVVSQPSRLEQDGLR